MTSEKKPFYYFNKEFKNPILNTKINKKKIKKFKKW